jgi:hypothetical protein
MADHLKLITTHTIVNTNNSQRMELHTEEVDGLVFFFVDKWNKRAITVLRGAPMVSNKTTSISFKQVAWFEHAVRQRQDKADVALAEALAVEADDDDDTPSRAKKPRRSLSPRHAKGQDEILLPAYVEVEFPPIQNSDESTKHAGLKNVKVLTKDVACKTKLWVELTPDVISYMSSAICVPDAGSSCSRR